MERLLIIVEINESESKPHVHGEGSNWHYLISLDVPLRVTAYGMINPVVHYKSVYAR